MGLKNSKIECVLPISLGSGLDVQTLSWTGHGFGLNLADLPISPRAGMDVQPVGWTGQVFGFNFGYIRNLICHTFKPS